MRRVVILGRGAAGKSTLARQLGGLAGLPVIELDAMFWQPGLTPAEPARWAARQRELRSRGAWIIDGDLGPAIRTWGCGCAPPGTIIVVDLAFPQVAWRTLRRGQGRADYWRWVWACRCRRLPQIRTAIIANAATLRTACPAQPRHGPPLHQRVAPASQTRQPALTAGKTTQPRRRAPLPTPCA